MAGNDGRLHQEVVAYPPAVSRIFGHRDLVLPTSLRKPHLGQERIEPLLAHRAPKQLGLARLTPLFATPPPVPCEENQGSYFRDSSKRKQRSLSRRKGGHHKQHISPQPPLSEPVACSAPPVLISDEGESPAPGGAPMPPVPPPVPRVTPPRPPPGGMPPSAGLAKGVYGAPVVPGMPRHGRRRRPAPHLRRPSPEPPSNWPAEGSFDHYYRANMMPSPAAFLQGLHSCFWSTDSKAAAAAKAAPSPKPSPRSRKSSSSPTPGRGSPSPRRPNLDRVGSSRLSSQSPGPRHRAKAPESALRPDRFGAFYNSHILQSPETTFYFQALHKQFKPAAEASASTLASGWLKKPSIGTWLVVRCEDTDIDQAPAAMTSSVSTPPAVPTTYGTSSSSMPASNSMRRLRPEPELVHEVLRTSFYGASKRDVAQVQHSSQQPVEHRGRTGDSEHSSQDIRPMGEDYPERVSEAPSVAEDWDTANEVVSLEVAGDFIDDCFGIAFDEVSSSVASMMRETNESWRLRSKTFAPVEQQEHALVSSSAAPATMPTTIEEAAAAPPRAASGLRNPLGCPSRASPTPAPFFDSPTPVPAAPAAAAASTAAAKVHISNDVIVQEHKVAPGTQMRPCHGRQATGFMAEAKEDDEEEEELDQGANALRAGLGIRSDVEQDQAQSLVRAGTEPVSAVPPARDFRATPSPESVTPPPAPAPAEEPMAIPKSPSRERERQELASLREQQGQLRAENARLLRQMEMLAAGATVPAVDSRESSKGTQPIASPAPLRAPAGTPEDDRIAAEGPCPFGKPRAAAVLVLAVKRDAYRRVAKAAAKAQLAEQIAMDEVEAARLAAERLAMQRQRSEEVRRQEEEARWRAEMEKEAGRVRAFNAEVERKSHEEREARRESRRSELRKRLVKGYLNGHLSSDLTPAFEVGQNFEPVRQQTRNLVSNAAMDGSLLVAIKKALVEHAPPAPQPRRPPKQDEISPKTSPRLREESPRRRVPGVMQQSLAQHVEQTQGPQPSMYWCVCGNQLMEDSLFCRKCGRSCSEARAQETAQPQQPSPPPLRPFEAYYTANFVSAEIAPGIASTLFQSPPPARAHWWHREEAYDSQLTQQATQTLISAARNGSLEKYLSPQKEADKARETIAAAASSGALKAYLNPAREHWWHREEAYDSQLAQQATQALISATRNGSLENYLSPQKEAEKARETLAAAASSGSLEVYLKAEQARDTLAGAASDGSLEAHFKAEQARETLMVAASSGSLQAYLKAEQDAKNLEAIKQQAAIMLKKAAQGDELERALTTLRGPPQAASPAPSQEADHRQHRLFDVGSLSDSEACAFDGVAAESADRLLAAAVKADLDNHSVFPAESEVAPV